ncbi:MAG: hypothetical protein ABI693_09355 [Bryobacteraceae bacterium]
MRSSPAAALIFLMLPCVLSGELNPQTVQAFDEYIRKTESRIDSHIREQRFLWADGSEERLARIRKGEIVTEPFEGEGVIQVPDGIIHDWTGSVFIPGATLKETLALVQNYDAHKVIYKPEVIDSRILRHEGNDFKIYLQLLKKKVFTVVLNTEHDVHYFPLDSKRCHSRSYSTRIAEVENYGKPDQRELPAGKDRGFLWKLYSYWRFQERDGGTYVECEAISLTRGIPAGTGWIVKPIIRTLPREALANSLAATRAALAAK